MSFFEELKRRNVFRVGIAYVVGGWLLLQVADILFEAFAAPDWSLRLVVILLLLGLPIALFFAWAFELTPEGIKREHEVDRTRSITDHTGRRLDRAIIAVLALALGYFVIDKFMNQPAPTAGTAALTPPQEAPGEAVAASGLPTDKSIAVLPFDHRSSREEDRFFTTGMHDDLLTELAQIGELRVISRTSVVQFENTDKSIREIAELLNVATILEGGVQRAGDQVRVNLQLIDAATDAHLWAKTYDRELTASNVFAIQSEIATAVAEAMRATLTPEDRARISDVPTENMAALEEYFKGRTEMDTRSLTGIESARTRFRTARELDPNFALAHAGEAQATLLLADDGTSYGDIPVAEANALARPLLERAITLAPEDAKVLATFGLLENSLDNYARADAYYDRSLAINPGDGEVLNWKRLNLAAMGRIRDSVVVLERMVELDPYSQVTLFNGAASLSAIGDGSPLKVEAILDRLETVNPGLAWTSRGIVRENQGRPADAAKSYFKALDVNPEIARVRDTLGYLLARLNLDAEALNVDPGAGDYLPFTNRDWEANLRLARQAVVDSDGGREDSMNLVGALVLAGEDEEALAVAEDLWARYGDTPQVFGNAALSLAVAARRLERNVHMQRYRDAYALGVRQAVDNDIRAGFRYQAEAALAAFDGREDDALRALGRAIDLGLRWDGWLDMPAFTGLHDTLGFQAERARMAELAEADRLTILSELCTPESTGTEWRAAEETCERWREKQRVSAAPI